VAFREIIENRDRMTGVQEFFRTDGADVARAAGNENIHAHSLKIICAVESSKTAGHWINNHRSKQPWDFLEPAFFVLDVNVDEILVAFGEINDSLNETDESAEAAGANADDDLNDSFLGVTEDEFMNSQAADQDAKDSAYTFLFRSRCFFTHKVPFFSRFLCLLGKRVNANHTMIHRFKN
jgi:hypothetical protein